MVCRGPPRGADVESRGMIETYPRRHTANGPPKVTLSGTLDERGRLQKEEVGQSASVPMARFSYCAARLKSAMYTRSPPPETPPRP